MKRFLLSFFCVSLIFISAISFAAGTVTGASTATKISAIAAVITLTWTADVAAATVPSTTIPFDDLGLAGWFLYSVETNPGAGPPTANYDIVLNDADGVDITGGLLMNRHTATTELVLIGTASHGYPVVRGDITFVLTNNSVNSAAGTCILILLRQ